MILKNFNVAAGSCVLNYILRRSQVKIQLKYIYEERRYYLLVRERAPNALVQNAVPETKAKLCRSPVYLNLDHAKVPVRPG